MPKKRFTTQYSKPPSTVPSSLGSSGASGSSSSRSTSKDATPSVNDLLFSLRKTNITPDRRPAAAVVTPTLPPQIRHLLSLPETPAPKPQGRHRRLRDANGRRLPAGPVPPKSWTEARSTTPAFKTSRERIFPIDVDHLPRLPDATRNGRFGLEGRSKNASSLQNMCLRRMAHDWDFVKEWERNNLADVPTGLRIELLSNIAVYGPDDGVGFDGLTAILMPQMEDETLSSQDIDNENFYRLDLSGSLGHSITLKQLADLVSKPQNPELTADLASWEDSLVRSTSLTAIVPHLTHLSLSHPPPTISWARLVAVSKNMPALTHLSLAYWPVPSLSTGSTTAVMSPKAGRDVQYGGTNYYSHTLDHDFLEAAMVLRRLAATLYSLEYLDLTGSSEWVDALCWKDNGEGGVDWELQWRNLEVLKLFTGLNLSEESTLSEISRFTQGVKNVTNVINKLAPIRKGKFWIDVMRDDLGAFDKLWKGDSEDSMKKRRIVDGCIAYQNRSSARPRTESTGIETEQDVARTETEVAARSVWDQ